MKRTSLRILAVMALFMFTMQITAKASDIATSISQVSGDELKAGTIMQVDIGVLGQTIVVVVDQASGALYVTTAPVPDINPGDTVMYTTVQKPGPKGTIIIRDVIRK